MQYIIVNRDNGEQNSFPTATEARIYLIHLLSLGITAYLITLPLWK